MELGIRAIFYSWLSCSSTGRLYKSTAHFP